MQKYKHVKHGSWRTVESFWNTKGTAFFLLPAGALIKIRYGAGSWFGKDAQKQKLNGESIRRLSVGVGSIVYARMQVKVSADTDIMYDFYPGDVSIQSPKIPF